MRLDEVRAALSVRDPGHDRRRRKRVAVGLGVVAVTAAVLVPVVVHTSQPAPLASPGVPCGELAVAAGPHRDIVVASLSAPGSGRSGGTVRATVTLRATGGTERVTSAAPAQLVVLREDVVVGTGGYYDYLEGAELPLEVTTEGTTVEATGALSWCVGWPPVLLGVERIRQPLPPGDYTLVAVVHDRGADPAADRLVTAPVPFTVTA